MDVYFMTSGAPEGSGSLCTPCRYSQPLVWGRLQTAICCFCCPDEGRHPGLPSPSRLTPKGQQTQGHVLPVGKPGSAAEEERGWPFLCRPPSCAFLRDARWCEDPGNEGQSTVSSTSQCWAMKGFTATKHDTEARALSPVNPQRQPLSHARAASLHLGSAATCSPVPGPG